MPRYATIGSRLLPQRVQSGSRQLEVPTMSVKVPPLDTSAASTNVRSMRLQAVDRHMGPPQDGS